MHPLIPEEEFNVAFKAHPRLDEIPRFANWGTSQFSIPDLKKSAFTQKARRERSERITSSEAYAAYLESHWLRDVASTWPLADVVAFAINEAALQKLEEENPVIRHLPDGSPVTYKENFLKPIDGE